MKWYNYKDTLIDLEKCYCIRKTEVNSRILFYVSEDRDFGGIRYPNEEDRDAEFEKIKLLMGIEKPHSRCC